MLFPVKTYRKKTGTLTAPRRTDELLEAIDTVAAYLGDERWHLGGGVSVALSIGDFYREHSDLDIVVQTSDLPGVYRRLVAHDYRLYSRKLMNHGRFGLAVYLPTRPGGWVMALYPHRLCFVHREAQIRNAYLSKLDLFLYDTRGTEYVALDGDFRIEISQPVTGHVHHTRSGRRVRCLNLHYMREFIARRGGPRHLSDALAITASVESARDYVRSAQRSSVGGRLHRRGTQG